jgi:hypothetical protein
MTRRFLLVTLFSTTAIVSPIGQAPNNAAMFDKIRTLVGDWEGTYQWSGSRTGSGTLTASYSLTGNATAIVENLVMAGQTAMTSVYHRDGSDLRMTHYCAANNQPRLKARRVDDAKGVIEFGFVDVTNATPGRGGYVQGATLEILGPTA